MQLFVFFIMFLIPFVWSQSMENSTTINVTGSGSTMVAQVSTSIHLTIQNRAESAQDAQQMTASAIGNVVTALNAFNVSDLQTEAISLQPVYNYTDSPPRLIEFESTESLSYKVSPELAGQTLDAAVRAGANVDSVESTSSKDALNTAYNSALEMATKDAENKARVVANSLNVCIVAPLAVTVPQNDYVLPTPTMYMAAAATMSAESKSVPTVIPGNTEVSATITIIYSQTPCAASGTQERRKRR